MSDSANGETGEAFTTPQGSSACVVVAPGRSSIAWEYIGMPEREPRKIQRRGRQEATAIVLEVVHLLATWGIERRELGCSGGTTQIGD